MKQTTIRRWFRPTVNYAGFRLRRINEPQFRHLWWLLFWPIYWMRFFLVELLNPATTYHPIYCKLDDLIPFQEWFIIPYMLWMVSMVAFCMYTLFYDIDTFQRYSKFLVLSMSVSSVVFLIYPSCQNLRPEIFPRNNILTDFVRILYSVDTNTNVFPSEHAIGSAALWAAAMYASEGKSPMWKPLVTVWTALTCFSTVFLKQHSILDIIAAIPICALAHYLFFKRKNINNNQGGKLNVSK